jgi:hypothetical protein
VVCEPGRPPAPSTNENGRSGPERDVGEPDGSTTGSSRLVRLGNLGRLIIVDERTRGVRIISLRGAFPGTRPPVLAGHMLVIRHDGLTEGSLPDPDTEQTSGAGVDDPAAESVG